MDGECTPKRVGVTDLPGVFVGDGETKRVRASLVFRTRSDTPAFAAFAKECDASAAIAGEVATKAAPTLARGTLAPASRATFHSA